MSCIPIPTHASTPFILGKSRMRKRARTDLCGGRSAMIVPTATVGAQDHWTVFSQRQVSQALGACAAGDDTRAALHHHLHAGSIV